MSSTLALPRGIETVNNSPEISRYYGANNLPYVNTAQVLSEILSEKRYIGQTFNVNGVEWCFKDGILDADLILKNEIAPIPNLNEVALKGSSSTVAIQTPNAVNSQDLVPLGQVQSLISAFPSVDTNIANTNLTFDSNRTHNLNAKKLKFTNGDFEVPTVILTQTDEDTKPNKIGTADGLIVKWTNKLGIQRVFAFLSDVLDKTTLIAQSVASQVTFNGTIVHNPATTPIIKSVIVLNAANEFKQADAVELMADDGSVTKYADEAALEAIYPSAVSGFELLCPNISTVNFPNGCIYKKTQSGWRVEKLYLISDV